MKFEYHPAADAFPLMDNDRFGELVESIREKGQIEAITLCEGMILDGRNRYRACVELGIQPKTRQFDGDPWQHAWILNGERRDLTADQRYLIWKHCHEKSEAFQAERKRIADEANRKRAAAAEARRGENGRLEPKPVQVEERPVREQVVPAQEPPRPGKTAKAEASKTNRGAVARGDMLAKARPDLAEKVRLGEIPMATAIRETKRDDVVKNLTSIETIEAKELSGVYDVIVIDPPWPMEKIERNVRPNQLGFEYPTMTIDEIKSMDIPAADDCHLFMWTTQKFLPGAFDVLSSWGFKYIFCMVWHKPGGFQPINMPQYNCEFVLYGRKGTPVFIDTKAFPTCFNAPRGSHSEKPSEFYDLVRRVTAGRKIDMFNRRKIEGFDTWGKEAK